MESHDFSWAAGFFDGEGWANRSGRGVQSRINHASLDGIPVVLTKFQRIVGVGRIQGPVIVEGKKPLYYWIATSRPDLLRVVERIAPWLCPVKRAEFERTLGGPLPPQVWPGSMSDELAWAGGFFDGEGSTYLEKHRTHPGYFYPVLYVPQCAKIGVAPELLRLRSAMGGIGNISGPRQDGPDWTPYRRWRVVTPLKVQAALHLLWPFMGDVKRAQAQQVMETIHGQPDLRRGNPAFGVAGARYCLRGHDKWNARIRPFKGRGRNEQDPLNHLRQCLACVREDAQARRNKKRRP
ncbi:MAG: hypothetical protein AABM32_11655 [Chloroflexota bacterium]